MSGLQLTLQHACNELGLKIELDTTIRIRDNLVVKPDAHITSLGGQNGILIFSDYNKVRPYRDAIVAANYAYSVFNDIPPDPETDVDTFIEIFTDWGWTGDPQQKPLWMKEQSATPE